MLADFHMQVSGINTMQLADDSTLCAKKDIIIAKFDQLLHKLGGEVNYLNRYSATPLPSPPPLQADVPLAYHSLLPSFPCACMCVV